MSDPFLGEIKMFGGNFAPYGYALCNGQQIAVTQNTALFAILGTTYGGNGTTTFGLPDFQGRSPIHWGNGAGLQPVVLGEKAGVESITLLNSNMPAHNHPIVASTGEGTTNIPPANGYLAAAIDKDLNPLNIYAAAPTNPVTMNSTVSGSGIPLATRNPFLSVSFIIALQGIFPTRN